MSSPVKAADLVLTETQAADLRRRLMDRSRSVLGRPYTTQGSYPAYERPVPTNPPAFNCSGYTFWVYYMEGVEIPGAQGAEYQGSQFNLVHELGNWTTNPDALKPGDLAFYDIGDGRVSGHVALWYGSRQVIHDYGAPGVCITTYNRVPRFIGGGAPFRTIPDPTTKEDDEMKPCFIGIEGRNTIVYCDWHDVHDCTDPEDLRIMRKAYKDATGSDIPTIALEPAEFARIAQTLRSDWPAHLQDLLDAYPSRSPEKE